LHFVKKLDKRGLVLEFLTRKASAKKFMWRQ